MINFYGPLFANVGNRLMSLKLVEYALTNAVMFSPKAEVLQPSEVRPVTLINGDMMGCALAQFLEEPELKGIEAVVLME
jgi:hypothetical protein